MEMKCFDHPRNGLGNGDLPRNDLPRNISPPDFRKPTSLIWMKLEGCPNCTERGEGLSRSGHNVAMRYNLNWIHEKES